MNRVITCYVLSTTSAHFDFIPAKMNLEMWTQSLYSLGIRKFSLSYDLTPSWTAYSLMACTASDILPSTDGDNSQHGRTYRQQKYIHYSNEIVIFITLLYFELRVECHILTLMPFFGTLVSLGNVNTRLCK